MSLGNYAKMATNRVKDIIKKKINTLLLLKFGLPILLIFIILITVIGGGAADESGDGTDAGVNAGSLQNVSSALEEYLLNFGGNRDTETYTIDNRIFYLSYNDGQNNLTVGRDIYMAAHSAKFSVPGYVSDTQNGPAKMVDNVYEYAIEKYDNGNGICIYIEKDLPDSIADSIRNSIWQNVINLETSLGTTFSMQQKYALCAIYYRRL